MILGAMAVIIVASLLMLRSKGMFDESSFTRPAERVEAPTHTPHTPNALGHEEAMHTLKAALTRTFKPDTGVRIGTMNGGLAILVGDTWAFHVAGPGVCSGNGSGHSLMRSPQYCEVGMDYDTIKAAADRGYQWRDL